MRTKIIENLKARFGAYADLIAAVDEALIGQKIDVPKHKSLGDHLWCVVGSRESYGRALVAGGWQGFACSMKAFSRDDFAAKLDDSARDLLAVIDGVSDWTPAREALLADLAEHEVMHEGQIIRHMYALERTLPASWKWA
jgi:hypothetical protein